MIPWSTIIPKSPKKVRENSSLPIRFQLEFNFFLAGTLPKETTELIDALIRDGITCNDTICRKLKEANLHELTTAQLYNYKQRSKAKTQGKLPKLTVSWFLQHLKTVNLLKVNQPHHSMTSRRGAMRDSASLMTLMRFFVLVSTSKFLTMNL